MKSQTIYQIKDIVHGCMLIDLIFEITLEKFGNLFNEIPFFEGCVEIHTPLVKG